MEVCEHGERSISPGVRDHSRRARAADASDSAHRRLLRAPGPAGRSDPRAVGLKEPAGRPLPPGPRRDSKIDVAFRLFGTVIWVIPIFWLGVLFQIVFAVWLGWLPPHGRWVGADYPRTVPGLSTLG